VEAVTIPSRNAQTLDFVLAAAIKALNRGDLKMNSAVSDRGFYDLPHRRIRSNRKPTAFCSAGIGDIPDFNSNIPSESI
jgi:hypothetical protein